MTTKPKPCTSGPKHQWAWLKNTTVTKGSMRQVHISLRGLYRCECGERKYGKPNHNGPDLRGLVGDGMFVAGQTFKKKDEA
ncbi:hypothetical protein [Tardiphaga sp. 862_B3_N1_1]|uniref:hypothetical protein n=1 Tax=Tardiphaga sp. 862_B3_N1_1 TaxID=3240763 RepID=UPI003F88D364